MALLARALVHVFFRQIEVEGAGNLPRGKPVVLVANHTNGLVDGLLLIATMPRYPRFLGKSTLFKVLPLKPLLRLAGVVPVHRPKDGESTDGNETSFRTCRAMLRADGVVAIFPEGISRDDTGLQVLKTGAARIALGAAFEDGGAPVVVVPVGLAYDNKARFRSGALVTIGEAFAVEPLRGRYNDDPRSAVRQLTDEIDSSLRSVGPDFASAAEAETFASVADVAALRNGQTRPTQADLARREDVARGIARAARDDSPPVRTALDELLGAHAAYRRDLALLGITDADVAANVSSRHVRAALARSLVTVVAAAPVAFVGAVVHVIPYQLMKQLAKLPKNEGIKSTVKLLGCMTLFVIEWLVLAVLAFARWGALAALVTLVVVPASGYVAVRFAERVRATGGLVRSYRTLSSVRRRGGVLPSVAANRETVAALAARFTGPGAAATQSAGRWD